MKIGIMQPYLFPYIGYFQLINAVDIFIIHDDVQYIQAGWINRNRILYTGREFLFTFGVKKDNYTKKINERYFSDNFLKEKKKFLGTLRIAYSKAPNYDVTFDLVEGILNEQEKNISIMTTKSLKIICSYLQIETQFSISSQLEKNNSLTSQDRVIELNKKSNSSHYINPIGGMELYSKEKFLAHGIQLSFLKPKDIVYQQFQNGFIPWLSIIDVLMFSSIEETKNMLNQYELI